MPVRLRQALVLALTAAFMVAALAVPASAQPRQEGLVNVTVGDVTVQVPVAVAANICGVAVNVLVQEMEQGEVDCEALAEAGAEGPPGNRQGPPTDQRGLVNVQIGDVTVQLPVAVAANVCGIAVNVLAQDIRTGEATCEAIADAEAGA
jgi:ABC-type spermidine/putrescine transport system permease subunit II